MQTCCSASRAVTSAVGGTRGLQSPDRRSLCKPRPRNTAVLCAGCTPSTDAGTASPPTTGALSKHSPHNFCL